MKKALTIVMMAAIAAAALFAHNGHSWREDDRWRGEHNWRDMHDRRGGDDRGRYGWFGPVSQESIPQAAQDFIAEYFPDRTVNFAGGNSRICKVVLSDGTEIGFTTDGAWLDIKSYAGVPLSVLPQEVANSARELYPNVPITRAEKKWQGFELKLANRMEMYFDTDGRLLRQKFDD